MLFRLCLLLLATAGFSPHLRAQTANQDSYLALQGVPFVAVPTVFSAGFGGPIASAFFDNAAWDYLDTLPASATAYPADSSGRLWSHPGFNKSTSSVSGWKTASLPIIAGPVDGFSQSPSILLGIGEGPGGANTVNTYLFRNTFSMTAAEALYPNWTMRMLADDGAVVFINGQEAGRINLPPAPGAVTPSTFALVPGRELSGDFAFPLQGFLRSGSNTISVELHQSGPVDDDAGFTIFLYQNNIGAAGFSPQIDAYGTANPGSSFPTYESGGGFGGSQGLRVRLADTAGENDSPASGAWQKTIRVTQTGDYRVSLRHRLTTQVTSNPLNANHAETILRVNGIRYGTDAGSSLRRQVYATSMAGSLDSGWMLSSFVVPLFTGDNVVDFGAYHTDKNSAITTNAYFDDLLVEALTNRSVLDNDTGSALTATLVSGPSHGTLTFGLDGAFSYVSDPDFLGQDSFAYAVSSGGGLSAPATVSLVVAPKIILPETLPETYATDEDVTLTVGAAAGVLADDLADFPASSFTAHLLSPPTKGTLTLASNGSFTYVPPPDYFGSVEFSYIAIDGGSISRRGSVSLQVVSVNDTPSAQDDAYTADRQGLLGVAAPGLLSNDSDRDIGDTLSAVLVLAPAHGTLNLNADGSFTYTADASFSGTDLFRYQARDSAGALSPEVVVLVAVNHAPFAVADIYVAQEDMALVVPALTGLLANDGDPDTGAVLSVSLVSGPTLGTLNLASDGSFSFTPPSDFFGEISFIYQVSDAGSSNLGDGVFFVTPPALVTLKFEPVNDRPVASDDHYVVVGSLLSIGTPGVLANDSDVDIGDSQTAVLATNPARGALTLNPDGSFSYLAEELFGGTDSFTYRARDAAGLMSDLRTVSIQVKRHPMAAPGSYTLVEDMPFAVAAPGVLTNAKPGLPGEALASFLVTAPSHGIVLLNSDGSFTYTPNLDYNGPDSFTFLASNSRDLSEPAVVSLTVEPADDVPFLRDDSYETSQGTSLVVGPYRGVLRNDRDPEGLPLTASVATPPTHGALTFAPDGSFSYTPSPDYSGADSFTYVASDGAQTAFPATVTLRIKSHAETIVISEVMYHPSALTSADKSAGFATPDLFEWFELHNPSAVSVDVSGWSVTKGVSFTFPAATSIPAGGWLVVAAHEQAFRRRNPSVTNFVAGWTGTLSDTSETIAVSDALGREMDSAFYADEGSFASRVTFVDTGATGWRWSTDADGQGKSLELRNPLLSNKRGHNWAASPAAGGTPGSANGSHSSNVAPLLSNLSHAPVLPRPGEPVVVTVRVEDEADTPPIVNLFWRVSTLTPGTFAILAMRDDGLSPDLEARDGVFTAAIPAQSLARTVLEFRVEATDSGSLTRSFPGATDGSGSLALCLVDNHASNSSQAQYRIVMTEADRSYFTGGSFSHSSDATQNITFIHTSGLESEVRYNSSLRYRGNSSRFSTPMTVRLHIPSDQPWNGRGDFNLNSQSGHLQVLGHRLSQLAELPGTPSRLVEVSLNGSVASYTYAQNDAIDGDFLKLVFPGDDDGNLYSKRRPASGVNTALAYRANTSGSSYIADGWSKESNVDSSDFSDLDQLLYRLNQATVPVSYASWWDYLNQVADLDQWARHIALNTFLNNTETNLTNGLDDDYDLYRPLLDGRFKIIPHDYDSIFNSTTTATLFQITDPAFVGSDTLPQFNRFYNDNKACRRFYFHLLDLANGLFLAENFAQITRGAIGYVDYTSFVAARRTYILSQIKSALTVTTNLTISGGYPTATTATALALSGNIPAALTDSVYVNGLKVTHNNRAGTWSAAAGSTATRLVPGLNRFVVECRDEAGTVIASSTAVVRYTTTSTIATIAPSGTTTWTLAGSPYSVGATLTVPSGATLVIEPGVTVQFVSGTALNVNGLLLAEGTAQAPVSFSGASGVASWNGVQISNSNQANRLRFCYFGGASPATAGMLGLTDSSALVEDCVFENSTRRRIRSENSDLTVRRCVFGDLFPTASPTAADNNVAEHIWGSTRLVGGTFLVENCVFGKLKGHNDALDVDGAHSPGTVMLIRNNTFLGGGDDAMDLQGDALIEGNLITNFVKDQWNLDPGNANGLSAGDDTNTGFRYLVIRNTFANCQQCVFIKENTDCEFHHNTVHGTLLSSLYFDLSGQTAGPGRSLNASGNIFSNCVGTIIDPAGASPAVTVFRNLSTKSLGAYHGDTFLGAPLFRDASKSDFGLRQESPARAAGPMGRDCGATCPPGPAVVGTPLTAATRQAGYSLSVGGPGVVAYQWRVNGGAWSADSDVSIPFAINGLTGNVLFEVRGRDFSGAWSEPLVGTWQVNPEAWPVLISEILASNPAGAGGSTDDYIELLNGSDEALDVSGLRLSDSPMDLLNPAKFTLPPGSLLPARGRLLLTSTSLGFSLSETGEGVFLYAPVTEGPTLLDSLTFGWQLPGLALARRESDAGWALAAPTPGTAFTLPVALADTAATPPRINEWLARTGTLIVDDFVELSNPSASPALISGYTLSDLTYHDPASRPAIPAYSYLPAGGFRAFHADGKLNAGTDHLAFKLDADLGHIQLRSSSSALVDYVTYGTQFPDRSQGRSPDSGNTLAYFNLPTPGFSNAGSATESALLAGLRITEIHFQPAGGADLEFVELRNVGASTLDLSGVAFASGIDFTFPPGSQLSAGAYVLVVHNLQVFKDFHGLDKPVSGVFSGRLDNAGERIRLVTSRGLAIQDFSYDASWQMAAAGLGSSLEIVTDTGANSSWSLGGSWRASLIPGGSPAGSSVFHLSAGADVSLPLPSALSLMGALSSNGPAAAAAFSWAKVSGPEAAFVSPSSYATAVRLSSPGTYVFRLTASSGTLLASDEVVVTATAPISAFDQWRVARFGLDAAVPNVAGDGADPDGDGLSNLLEYALGGDPLSEASRPALPTAELLGEETLSLTFRRSLAATDLVFTLEESDSFPNFVPVVGAVGTVVSNDGTTEVLRFEVPAGASPSRFLRLRISRP